MALMSFRKVLSLHDLKELVFLVFGNSHKLLIVHDDISSILVDVLFDVLEVDDERSVRAIKLPDVFKDIGKKLHGFAH